MTELRYSEIRSIAAGGADTHDFLDDVKPHKNVDPKPVATASGTDTGLSERDQLIELFCDARDKLMKAVPESEWKRLGIGYGPVSGQVFPEACAFELSDIGPQGEPLFRYSEDQPRDPNGEFAHGSAETTEEEMDKMSPEEWEADHAQGLVDKVNAWVWTSDFVGEEAASDIREGRSNVIVDAIRESEPVNQTCYRGMFCDKTPTGEKWDAMSWKTGQEVQIMPSSFSTNEKSASEFATGETQGLHGEKGMTQLMIKVEPGMKGLRVEDYATGQAAKVTSDEHEIISGGRYQVISISRNQTGYPVIHPTSDTQVGKVYNSLRVITVRQIGVF